LAGDVLHDRDGALADERDRVSVGANAVAGGADDGVGGGEERGWRATFYTTGMEHSPTSATGTGWERTP
jgi:hypothetical protein